MQIIILKMQGTVRQLEKALHRMQGYDKPTFLQVDPITAAGFGKGRKNERNERNERSERNERNDRIELNERIDQLNRGSGRNFQQVDEDDEELECIF